MFEGVSEQTVAAVQATDPVALASVIAPLTEQQLRELSIDEAECVVAASQRVINALSARQAVAVQTFAERAQEQFCKEEADYEARWRALAAADGDPDWTPTPPLMRRPRPEQMAAGMLAPILRLAPRTMVSRIESARVLGCLPRTFALAFAGDLEPHRAAIVAAVAARVGIDHWVELEARLHHANVVPMTGSQLKTRALKVAQRIEQQGGDMTDAEPGRWVRIQPNDSPGSTTWEAQLPADRSQQMWAAIEQLAEEYIRANQALTVEQARADALVDLLLTDVQVSTSVQIVLPADSGPVPTDGDGQPDNPAGQRDSRGQPDSTAGQADRDGYADRPPNQTDTDDHADRPPNQTDTDDPADRTPNLSDDDPGSVRNAWRACLRGLDIRRARERELVVGIELAESLLVDSSGLESYVGDAVSYLGRIDINRHLARDTTGDRVWFVPSPVSAPGIGCLLPAQLNRLLSDPDITVRLARAHPDTGAVDALDEKTYRPGAALARAVRARDGTCRCPGCATPAERCHLDHVIRHPDGPTSKANLQSLCVAHHGFKHHADWTVTMTPEGICTWTAPNGRTHTTHPRAVHDEEA